MYYILYRENTRKNKIKCFIYRGKYKMRALIAALKAFIPYIGNNKEV